MRIFWNCFLMFGRTHSSGRYIRTSGSWGSPNNPANIVSSHVHRHQGCTDTCPRLDHIPKVALLKNAHQFDNLPGWHSLCLVRYTCILCNRLRWNHRNLGDIHHTVDPSHPVDSHIDHPWGYSLTMLIPACYNRMTEHHHTAKPKLCKSTFRKMAIICQRLQVQLIPAWGTLLEWT